MAFEGLDIEAITEAHITALIGVSESRDLDFKQATYGNADSDKREFLADISAFANTIGGHIVIGIAEDKGIATGLTPFTADADAEILRLESITLTGLQPRIMGLRIRAIPFAGGGKAIVVYIPRSWNGPHRVIAQNSNRFHMRAGSRKYEPDVEELRQLFTSGATFTQRLRDFQYDRIAKISSGATPVPIMGGERLVVHIIPYSAFLTPDNFDMGRLWEARTNFMPIERNSTNWRINLEGIVAYAVSGRTSSMDSSAYTQIWRNGCVEAVQCQIAWHPDGHRIVSLPALARDMVNSCTNYMQGLNNLGVSTPVGIFVTMMGVNDADLLISLNNSRNFDRDMLFFSEVIIDSYPQAENIRSILKPIFDQIAHAAGYESSPDFDANGNIVRI